MLQRPSLQSPYSVVPSPWTASPGRDNPPHHHTDRGPWRWRDASPEAQPGDGTEAKWGQQWIFDLDNLWEEGEMVEKIIQKSPKNPPTLIYQCSKNIVIQNHHKITSKKRNAQKPSENPAVSGPLIMLTRVDPPSTESWLRSKLFSSGRLVKGPGLGGDICSKLTPAMGKSAFS